MTLDVNLQFTQSYLAHVVIGKLRISMGISGSPINGVKVNNHFSVIISDTSIHGVIGFYDYSVKQDASL